MSEYVITTFDWVPEIPRGYVRDIRLRWALEEAKFDYQVKTTSFENRNNIQIVDQPFGQVPWLKHGSVSLFESGAILLYLAEQSTTLMPQDPIGRSKVIEWLFAALNSVEMASLPWSIFEFLNDEENTVGRRHLNQFLEKRLMDMEKVLTNREWLADKFSIADIAMIDVLRLVKRLDGLTNFPALLDYVARGMQRPAFKKAYSDQVDLYNKADI